MNLIRGERRLDRRYDVQLAVHFRVVRGSRILMEGSGTTCDMSKGGVSFYPGRMLPARASVEMSLEWPVLLGGEEPLELRLQGRVVRSGRLKTAVRITWHRFVRAERFVHAGMPGHEVLADSHPLDTNVLVM